MGREVLSEQVSPYFMDQELRLREAATSSWVDSQEEAQATLGGYTPVWGGMEEMQAATAYSVVVPESRRGRA